jgi:hypothetical protein
VSNDTYLLKRLKSKNEIEEKTKHWSYFRAIIVQK